jgi:hypothetical protein
MESTSICSAGRVFEPCGFLSCVGPGSSFCGSRTLACPDVETARPKRHSDSSLCSFSSTLTQLHSRPSSRRAPPTLAPSHEGPASRVGLGFPRDRQSPYRRRSSSNPQTCHPERSEGQAFPKSSQRESPVIPSAARNLSSFSLPLLHPFILPLFSLPSLATRHSPLITASSSSPFPLSTI